MSSSEEKEVDGILVDPEARVIRKVRLADRIWDFHEVIGAECMDTLRLDERNVMFLDDTGLVAGPPFKKRFGVRGYPYPLAGKGLVVGVGRMGETRSSDWSVEDLEAVIIWGQGR